MCTKWQTRVRGVQVCGRNVYLTDCGCRLGYQGPLVETNAFLADLRPDLADQIRVAIPVIVAHHERRLSGAPVSDDPAGQAPDANDQMWGGSDGYALPDSEGTASPSDSL